MFAQLTSATTLGVNAFAVQVEVDVSGGLPGMLIVGLPDAAVQESRERVRAAVRNAGLPFPASRIVVNLAPADVRKEGPMFDLPIALAVLLAQGVIPQSALDRTLVAGELALDGSLRPVRGAINLALYAAQAGVTRLLLPPASAPEAAAVGEIAVYAPATLAQTVAFLTGELPLAPVAPEASEPAPPPSIFSTSRARAPPNAPSRSPPRALTTCSLRGRRGAARRCSRGGSPGSCRRSRARVLLR